MMSFGGHPRLKSLTLAIKLGSSMGCPTTWVLWMAHYGDFSMHHCFIPRIIIKGKAFTQCRR